MEKHRMVLLGKILVSLLGIVWLSNGMANSNYESGSASSNFFSDGFVSESIVVAANKKPSWYKPKPSGTGSGAKKTPVKKPGQQGKLQPPKKQQAQRKQPKAQQPKNVKQQKPTPAISKVPASHKASKNLSGNLSGRIKAVRARLVNKNIKINASQSSGHDKAPRKPEFVPYNYNRAVRAAKSGVKPGLSNRAYSVIDGVRKNGGLKSDKFNNSGKRGEVKLPSETKSGTGITYTRTYLRPSQKGKARGLSNARVVTGSDGSAWVSRHYGQARKPGGKQEEVLRIQ